MENVKQAETYLPLFSGFYGSFLELDVDYIQNFIDEERKEKGLYSDYNIDNLKIDHEAFENDIVKYFSQELETVLSDYKILNNITVQKINRPKTYNFKNDSVDVSIEYNVDVIKDYIYSHSEAFKLFLKKRYTSCDGFFSHYSNDFEQWENDTSHFSDFSKNGHYLGSILDFIIHELKINELDFFDDVFDRIDPLEYAENLTDIIEYSDNSLFDFLTKNGINEKFSDYIVTSYNNKVIDELILSENILSIIREYENTLVNV